MIATIVFGVMKQSISALLIRKIEEYNKCNTSGCLLDLLRYESDKLKYLLVSDEHERRS